jgi:hypothetical protein
MNSPSVMVLIVAVGAALSIGGCKSASKRGDPTSTNEPVNATLNNLANESGLALPEDEQLMDRGDEFGSVSDQIEESARQLNVYFANMEIDGVDEVDPESRTRIPLGGTSSTADPISEPIKEATQIAAQPLSTPKSTSNEGAFEGSSDGVRVSLLGASEDEESPAGIAEEIPAQHQEEIAQSAAQEQTELTPDAGDKPSVQAADNRVGGNEPTTHEPIAQDPNERKEQLAQELATILAQLAGTSDDPGSAALALASLEMLLPDDSSVLLEEGVLSDAEQESIDAIRGFLRSLSSAGSIASPGEVLLRLSEIQSQLDTWLGVSVKKAALCTRVDGYGRYETFPSYRFVAGRAQPAIVYVELEHFAQRESVGPDGQPRFETKLSQRLELYRASDDLNTWNRATETVNDMSRNRVRDYYLINEVVLPPNLGVGRYHLKIVVRDLIGEGVAETIIPIEIVVR